MTEFKKNPLKVGGSISDDISSGRGSIKMKLALKDNIEELILIIIYVFYVSHSLSHFVSLGLPNNIGIFYHNKDQTIYNQETRKIFTFAK